MKIGYLSGYSSIPSKDANSVHIMKMCEAYEKNGIRVELFVSKRKDNDIKVDIFEHYMITKTFKIIRTPFPKKGISSIIQLYFFLPFLAKIRKVEIIHTRNLASAWGSAKLMKLPTIFELHNMPESNQRTQNIFKSLINSKKLKFIIVITHALKTELEKNYEISVPIIVLPDGVSERNLNHRQDKEVIRRELNIFKNDKIVCTYTGQLYKGRGIELIIELAKRLNDFHFYIVGGRPEDIDYYKSKSNDILNITFAGFKSQLSVLKYQIASDILLMPYSNEIGVAGTKNDNTASYASPLKMFEYLAVGRPIVSSSLPVLKEVLKNRVNSILIDYDEIDLWTKELLNLKNDENLRLFLSMNAKSDASKFTWENRASLVLKMIEKDIS